MKAIIVNSGIGSRMGELTEDKPKCMTNIRGNETIISYQLKLLKCFGIRDVVITTGYLADVLVSYVESLKLHMNITFVNNEKYRSTNYIYSIYLAKEYVRDDDVLLLHGDLVFEAEVLYDLINNKSSQMVVSSTLPLPEKDFKAVIDNDEVQKVGIEFFENAMAAQPLYKLNKDSWSVWLDEICSLCENNTTDCYAENALNAVSDKAHIKPYDAEYKLCMEIDTVDDLNIVKSKLSIDEKTVYMCFSTDVIHGAHIKLINRAALFGSVIIGVLTDEAVASYKHYPLVPYNERASILKCISNVSEVTAQETLSYKDAIEKYKPDYIIHGDDWKQGTQKAIRDEVVTLLNEYGGKLIEFPYSADDKYRQIEKRFQNQLSMPDIRRARLKNLIEIKGCVNAIEAHSGITGLIAEKTSVVEGGKTYQFDAMWVSSLCDSTSKGKPDIELVDMTSRFRTIDDIMEVTTKPIIFDGDSGGLAEHFVYTVRTLERMGVSMVIIEDKVGLKKNSLFGTDANQTQDTIENFCNKIAAGKQAVKTKDFMICARIESLILEQGMDDALKRANAYVAAGADAIMIHSRQKDPSEVFEFIEKFRSGNISTPIVVVPTSFNSVTEDEFKNRGANVVIYANQLTRSGFPAMQKTAETILKNHRALEADEFCMSIKEIINLIPEDAD